jgi:hypothetical protein
MSINLLALMKQRYDTAANWTAQNPTLLAGEIGIESDTKKWKVGTGSTAWASLAYAIGGTYPIVNADIAAGAEIAVSKLADGSARQLLQTDAAGTGVEWTSDVSIPGVLAVTAGTAALPGIAVSGDPNTGIYSPGADQIGVATGGTSRIVVDASGNVNIDSSTFYVDAANNRVGIGTASPSAPLEVFATSAGVRVTSSNTGTSYINMGDTDSANIGGFEYYHTTNNLAFIVNAAERMRIDSSGRLLVGTSSARSFFSNNDTPAFQVEGTTTTGREASITSSDSGTSGAVLLLAKQRSGTIGGNTIVQSGDQIGYFGFQANDGSKMIAAAVIEGLVDGTPGTNDMPGRLVFSTTADGAASPTEAMRIKSTRIINFSNAPTFADNTAATAGGLAVGDVYKTVLGVLMIRF